MSAHRATLAGIGYQGRSLTNLCETLAERGVELLIDVRARAWSNRPEFRKTALANALAARGIMYLHLKEAGNPFRPKPGEILDPAECLANYERYLESNPSVVEAVRLAAQQRIAALLCYEAASSSCHRGAILKAVSGRAFDL